MSASQKISIIEVGARDGLQNEKVNFSVSQRMELISRLVDAGESEIEAGAFVSEKWIPQMAGSLQLIQDLRSKQRLGQISEKVRFSALVPNEKGMEAAILSGVKEIAVFAACSESFSQKNINCSISESFARFTPVIKMARKNKIKVRGYLSTVFGCPYEGKVSEKIVFQNAKKLIEMGCYEVSMGDTIGMANPVQVEAMVKGLKRVIGLKKMAMHFHDTQRMALANIYASLQLGITRFDSSVGGLGGCPYAQGASGNVATEDVVNMLHSMGYKTGIDLSKLSQTSRWLETVLNRQLKSLP